LSNIEKPTKSAAVDHDAGKAVAKMQSDAYSAPPGPNQTVDAAIPLQLGCFDASTKFLPSCSFVSSDSTDPLPSSCRPSIDERPFLRSCSDSNEKAGSTGDRLNVGMAWNGADNLGNEDPVATMARHNLVFGGPESFGLKWNCEKYPGLATEFTKESIGRAQVKHEELVEKNPRIATLAEIRYRDAPSNYLPADSNWWQRDSSGNIVEGYPGKGLDYKMLDIRKPEFQDHVATQAAAAVKSGAAGGIMLDWFNDGQHKGTDWDDARLQMLTKIRTAVDAVDPHAKIFINTNAETVPDNIAASVDGYYMECNQSSSVGDWMKITAAVDRAEQQGKIPFVETWPDKNEGREEVHKMRATTTMVMTHAPDGYALFADPDGANSKEHLHDWYSFYDTKVGKAVGTLTDFDGSSMREYENGTVLYNPIGNKPVTVTFHEPHTSAATGKTGESFVVNPEDGDIFLPK